jgi:uncharacterized membrane protein
MPRIHSTYNQLAGKNVERIVALGDGIYSVAMTLLVLDLHVPDAVKVVTENDFLFATKLLLPRLLIYLMSFTTLGIFWIGTQTVLDRIERSDRHFSWLNLAFFVLLTLVPFSTSLLATFITFRSALLVYWANLFLLGASILSVWLYAWKFGLMKTETNHAFHRAVTIRVVSAQAYYAGAVLLSFVFNTYVSIGLIVLIQLNYAFAPKLVFRRKSDEV